MKPQRHIRRVDRPSFHGWVVTVQHAGRLWSSYFRDGNGDEALDRAIAYRDAMLGRGGGRHSGTVRKPARRATKPTPRLW